jgi:predicted dehydrogenase
MVVSPVPFSTTSHAMNTNHTPGLNLSEFDRRSFLAAAGGSLVAMSLLPELGLATLTPRLSAKLPVAIVGCGRHGRALLDELQKIEAISVVAVCDVDQGRVDALKRRAPEAATFTNHAEMLTKLKDIAAVVIATPTHLHKAIALDAIAAGKHVFCEAPLAHTVEDCKAIAKAAAGAKTIFQVGLYARSNPVYKLARSFFRSDSVRDMITLRGQNFRKQTWRFPSSDPARDKDNNWRLDETISLGLAGELGTHQYDVFHFFTGKYPEAITGYGAIRLHRDGRKVADTVHTMMDMGEGAMLAYVASLGNSFEGRQEVLHGSNAAIKLSWSHGWLFKESDAPTQGWEVYANRQQFHNDEGITLIADATKLASQGKLKEGVGLPYSPQYYALVDFVASIADGKAVACGADEGARCSIIGILANQAVTGGSRVAVGDDMLKM